MSTDQADERSDAVERLVGTVVADKYRIDRVIGQGGMGAVFQATNITIGKRVALKFLSRDAARDRDAAERFQREALAASLVESAHIVQIFDSGTSADGLPFLVMELLSGEDLRARLKREGTLSIEESVNIAAQVLRALVRAHRAGIVHRDLKPDNIFVCKRDDDALFVKIVDFGISKLGRATTLDTLTRRGTVLGTAYYMSPEQAQAFADIDGRTDLFSVGAIVFECLAGRPPHVGPTYEAVLIAICTKDAPDVRTLAPDVPEALARVVRKALARDRAQRYQDATEMLDALIAAVPSAFVAPFGSTPSGSTFHSVEPSHHDGPAAFASTSRAPNTTRLRNAGTLVMAVVAVLAGFALTAPFMKPKAEPEVVKAAAASQQPSARVEAPPSIPSPPLPPPAVSAVAHAPTPEPPASTKPAAVAAPKRPATGDARPSKPSSRERRAVRPAGETRAGVAQGLQLSTKEP